MDDDVISITYDLGWKICKWNEPKLSDFIMLAPYRQSIIFENENATKKYKSSYFRIDSTWTRQLPLSDSNLDITMMIGTTARYFLQWTDSLENRNLTWLIFILSDFFWYLKSSRSIGNREHNVTFNVCQHRSMSLPPVRSSFNNFVWRASTFGPVIFGKLSI